MNLPMQAEKLLPHRGQMLLLDSVLTVEEELEPHWQTFPQSALPKERTVMF